MQYLELCFGWHTGTLMPRNSDWIARRTVRAFRGHVCKGDLTWGPLSCWISKCCVWLYLHCSSYVLAWTSHTVHIQKRICIHFKIDIVKRAEKAHAALFYLITGEWAAEKYCRLHALSLASCLTFLPKQWPIFKTKGLKHHELSTMGFKPLEAKDILNPTFLGWILWPLC